MNIAHVDIEGGDYLSSGRGSKQIKEELCKSGVVPEIMRRAIVAVYEAEMNVAIHAYRGLVEDCGLVALYACCQGCFGSPFWDTPPAVARLRAVPSGPADGPVRIHALQRLKPLEPRAGARLDPDMSTAIKKLAQINQISKQLPGRNCGICGAPSCLALAEDVVMDRATLASCIFMGNRPDAPGAIKEDHI